MPIVFIDNHRNNKPNNTIYYYNKQETVIIFHYNTSYCASDQKWHLTV